MKKTPTTPINERIRFNQLQLIGYDGENRGVVSRKEALKEAEEHGLDLVLLTESGGDGYPVAKILDYGKLLYEKKKQKAEAKKKQQVIQVKEVKLRPKIAEHDFETKLKQALTFLNRGKRVKFTIMFRGRETMRQEEIGQDIWQRIVSFFEENDLQGKTLAFDKDTRSRNMWSRVVYTK